MLNKLIGIISYLPDDETVREVRKWRLSSLMASLGRIFPDVPICIIAQNWRDFDVSSADVRRYDEPLGILGARRELRRVFLDSEYEYLIMIDDDCCLLGFSGERYLDTIDDNPNCFYEKVGTSLKLFCIHRSLFDDYPDIDPQKGEGYEDRAFVATLRERYPERRVVFRDTGLDIVDNATNDRYTTWERVCDCHEMLVKTDEFVKIMKDEHAKFNELRNVDSFSHVVEYRE